MTNFVVSRKFKLAEPLAPQQRAILDELPGIKEWHEQSEKLQVKYDASQLQLMGIIEQAQLKPVSSRLQQWRLQYYRFTDQNLAQESGHTPSCCNKLPR